MTSDSGDQPPHVVAAVDVGGTTIKGAVYIDGRALSPGIEVPTHGVNSVPLENLDALLDRLLSQAVEHGFSASAVGIATPGRVDDATGTVLYAANLGWRDVALSDHVSRRTGLPTSIAHDARAAAVSEHVLGVARDVRHFVVVPVGTGVGSAIMTDGVTFVGAMMSAGEIGHVSVIPDGERCVCGMRGCVEAYASGSSIARRYQTATGSPADAREVVSRLPSDADARRIWSEAMEALARGVAGLVASVDPELVVFGGGLAQAGDALLTPVTKSLGELLAWRPLPAIRLSSLGPRAAREGVALLAASAC